ncbi:MAG: LacI family DNA-binding transcriptional regulator [Candidatus Humimicrobiaceae bacterium]
MENKLPTMNDVAKRAGTSVFTVSSVINESKPVSLKLRKRVLKAIKELDYIPNSIAKSLKGKRSFLIGVVISDVEDIFFPRVIRGIEEVVNKENINMILCNTKNSPEKEEKYLKILFQKKVDGLILFTSATNDENLKKFQKWNIPVVLIDREIESSNISAVIMDDCGASFEVTNYLIKKGHKRIGIILFSTSIKTGEQRLKGYIDAHKKNNVDLDKRLIKVAGLESNDSFRATNELLSLDDKPTAIFTTNDVMLLGALKSINNNNLKIPHDISLITFFDFGWLKYLNPPITAVKLPTFEMGSLAAELLIKLINSKEENYPKKIVLKTQLIERDSVKSLRN